MGRNNKKYSKPLKNQAYDALKEKFAFSESKRKAKDEAKKTGEKVQGIYSFKTYENYMKTADRYIDWLQINHPEITTLKKAKAYTKKWLESEESAGKSAWTLHSASAALNKLFGITKDDKEYYKAPPRHRENIKRSRDEAVRDKHFSITNNAALIDFCQGTGLRRGGLEKITNTCLWKKEAVLKEIQRIEKVPKSSRTEYDMTTLEVFKYSMSTFSNQEYFIHVKEKGGRWRLSPIVGPHVDDIIRKIQNTPNRVPVWSSVHSAADIHGYRGDYAAIIYKMYARKIEDIPYDRHNAKLRISYQSEVYHARADKKGQKYDRIALRIVGQALGHGPKREELVVSNYGYKI